MKRFLLRSLRVALGLAVLLIVFGSTAYLSFNQFVRRGAMQVPDLIGLPLAEAEMVLLDQGLKLRWLEGEDRFDDTVPAGMVLEHDPGPGSMAKRGGSVKVILSRGQQLVEVPDLSGKVIQAAQVNLAASGLSLGRRTSVFSDGGEPGTVVRQSPPPGAEVDRSTPVDVMVLVDNTNEVFIMPDLVYRTEEEVRQFFTSHGFKLGSVKYEPYEGIPEGVVLRQYPLMGHPLRRRDVIALVVSAAPNEDT